MTPQPPPATLVRPYVLGDAEALFEAATESVADAHPWLPWCHPGYALADARAWVEQQVAAFAAGLELDFAIVDPGGRFLGGCGVNQIVNRRGNLGYWVRSSETGKGIAATAARLVARWAFENTDMERLEILVAVDNRRSLRVAEKVGAVREGVLRRRLCNEGTIHDAVVFSLVRGDRLG